jgi:hypothetical protein
MTVSPRFSLEGGPKHLTSRRPANSLVVCVDAGRATLRAVSDEGKARVLIDEMSEWDEAGPVALARFKATAFDADENPLGHIEDLSLEDALAWSRDRATVVEVRLSGWGENLYSAGIEASAAPPLAEAPPITLRRPAGWEFLDRTEADEPISWDVVVEAALAHTIAPDALERFPDTARAACATAGHELLWVRRVMPTVTSSDGRGWTRSRYSSLIIVRLQACTAHQAITLAENLARAALSEVGIDLLDQSDAFESAPFATGSRAAQANVKL